MGGEGRIGAGGRTPAPATPASVFVVSGTVEQLNAMVTSCSSLSGWLWWCRRSVCALGQHARSRVVVSQSRSRSRKVANARNKQNDVKERVEPIRASSPGKQREIDSESPSQSGSRKQEPQHSLTQCHHTLPGSLPPLHLPSNLRHVGECAFPITIHHPRGKKIDSVKQGGTAGQ